VTIISPNHNAPNDTDPFIELAPGVVYNFSPRIALRGDVGWWSGIKGGLTFSL
jgi:hypothetical protein